MNLQKWFNEGRLQRHVTNKEEIQNLFKLIERDLKDAEIKQLSTDRRFATGHYPLKMSWLQFVTD